MRIKVKLLDLSPFPGGTVEVRKRGKGVGPGEIKMKKSEGKERKEGRNEVVVHLN